MGENRPDLTRTTLAVLFIGGMLTTCFYILGPFLAAIVWAATLVIATFPLMLRVQRALGGRRAIAVTVMTVMLLLVFVVPFWFAIGTIVRNAGTLAEWGKNLATFKVPPPPDWIGHLPMVGDKAVEWWNDVVDMGLGDLAPQLAPYAGRATNWFVDAVGNLGLLFLQFVLTVIIAAIMYFHGEATADLALKFSRRLAGERGMQAAVLAGKAIRGVALAVVVTAIAQSILGGVAMTLAGVPFASVLTAVMFMMCVAQIGPVPVLLPEVIWMYWAGSSAWATFLFIASIVVVSLDNLLRPILIKKGADLPIVLILAGVIGGLLSFGLVGIFLGPAVLAVSYTLLREWMDVEAT